MKAFEAVNPVYSRVNITPVDDPDLMTVTLLTAYTTTLRTKQEPLWFKEQVKLDFVVSKSPHKIFFQKNVKGKIFSFFWGVTDKILAQGNVPGMNRVGWNIFLK